MARRDFHSFLTLASLAFRAAPSQALQAVGCLIRGKRVRGWNQLGRAAATHPRYYQHWIRVAEPLRIEEFIAGKVQAALPQLAVLVLGSADISAVQYEKSVGSARVALGDAVAIYTYPLSQDDSVSFGSEKAPSLAAELKAIAASGAKWFLPMLAGDTLSPHLGSVLQAAGFGAHQSPIIYWDEDVLVDGKRANPWVKPDWDELLFLARDCLSGAALFSLTHALTAAEEMESEAVAPRSIAGLAIEIVGKADGHPCHLPLILAHRRDSTGFSSSGERGELIAISWPNEVNCSASASSDDFALISPPSPQFWPSVSILIPTRDRGHLLEACVSSIQRLQYDGRIEILVIDNGSSEPYARALLKRLADGGIAQIIEAPGPFNFSKLNNLAAERASGEFLCLMNNDIEAQDGEWLTQMIRHATVEGVGAVGAQLLYPDGSLQHAGVAIGIGGAAGHVEKGRAANDPGHFGWAVTREVSAVTAACMVVRKNVYQAVGGLDERIFPVAFNDVDFCLRLKRQGLHNRFVAEARLVHHESVSRGNDLDRANFDRFQKELSALQERWQTQGHQDRHFSPLFSTTSEQCILAF